MLLIAADQQYIVGLHLQTAFLHSLTQ